MRKNIPALFIGLLLCSAGTALAQQNRAYTGGSGDGYAMAERLVHAAPTGLAEEALEKAIRLYPNPSRQGTELLLQAGPAVQIREIVLRDISGKALFELRPPQGGQGAPVSLPTAALPAGLYLLQCSSSKATIVKKVLLL